MLAWHQPNLSFTPLVRQFLGENKLTPVILSDTENLGLLSPGHTLARVENVRCRAFSKAVFFTDPLIRSVTCQSHPKWTSSGVLSCRP